MTVVREWGYFPPDDDWANVWSVEGPPSPEDVTRVRRLRFYFLLCFPRWLSEQGRGHLSGQWFVVTDPTPCPHCKDMIRRGRVALVHPPNLYGMAAACITTYGPAREIFRHLTEGWGLSCRKPGCVERLYWWLANGYWNMAGMYSGIVLGEEAIKTIWKNQNHRRMVLYQERKKELDSLEKQGWQMTAHAGLAVLNDIRRFVKDPGGSELSTATNNLRRLADEDAKRQEKVEQLRSLIHRGCKEPIHRRAGD